MSRSAFRRRPAPTFAAVLAVLLATAGAARATHPHDEHDDAKRHATIAAAANWSEATEVVIELGEHQYAPEEFTLKVGQPYRILLKNVGNAAHDMVGGSFFDEHAIALRMVTTNAGRVIAQRVSSVYVRPKNDIELWLVPMKEGRYSFFCSLPGHREDGMEGVVRVER